MESNGREDDDDCAHHGPPCSAGALPLHMFPFRLSEFRAVPLSPGHPRSDLVQLTRKSEGQAPFRWGYRTAGGERKYGTVLPREASPTFLVVLIS